MIASKEIIVRLALHDSDDYLGAASEVNVYFFTRVKDTANKDTVLYTERDIFTRKNISADTEIARLIFSPGEADLAICYTVNE